jgi:hypothetical protein
MLALLLCLLVGCDGGGGRMAHPEDPQGRYHDQIAAARHVLEQNEDWASRAEWEVTPSGGGWKVTAWRVEHPGEKGAGRYLPWGYSVIELNSRIEPVRYVRKG